MCVDVCVGCVRGFVCVCVGVCATHTSTHTFYVLHAILEGECRQDVYTHPEEETESTFAVRTCEATTNDSHTVIRIL